MAESHVVSGLKAKRDEIQRAIRDHQNKIKAARDDLATLNQALAIFGESSGKPKSYLQRSQLFRRGELMRIIFDALRDAPDGLSVHDLALIAMKDRGMDADDVELHKRVIRSVSIALSDYRRSGRIRSVQRSGQSNLWKIGAP